ncbi:MAG: hypothetical protein JRD89_10530 [Deltaproteobacteria bacterium]|nr:hypothetical protein [Deltaproteobacteria bacterium]
MIKPMLAETAKEPFDSDRHIFEVKWDGVRCIVLPGGRLQARSGADITDRFPEIRVATRKPAVLDGEIVCFEGGLPSFPLIQQRIHKQDRLAIRLASRATPATFIAFDVLYVDGESVMEKPLLERKGILSSLKGDSSFAIGDHIMWNGIRFFQACAEKGLEGVMAKDTEGRYLPGKRTPYWLKVKAFKEEKFLICGLTEGENERANTFGSLVLGKETESGLVYVGNAGSGFSEEMLATVLKLASGLKGDCPFPEAPKMDRAVKFWVEPFLWCEVRYLEYGSDGKLRFPTFRGLVSACY